MLHALWTLAQANPGEDVGKQAGAMISGLAKPVYLSVVGLGAIGLMMGRKYTGVAVFLIVALVVGIVVLVPNEFGGMASDAGHFLGK